MTAIPVSTRTISDRTHHVVAVASVSLIADPEGALYWPEQDLLAVSDLHLEKGSSFAARGMLLPPAGR